MDSPEAIEGQLRGGEVDGGVQAARELPVGQPVDEARRERQCRLGLRRVAGPRGSDGEHRMGRREQHRLAEGLGLSDGTRHPDVHLVEREPEEAVHRELDRERDRLGEPAGTCSTARSRRSLACS